MNDDRTFSDLGAAFPLFDAPANQASQYQGAATCSLCETHAGHTFLMGIGCALMCSCPSCGTLNGLDADDQESVNCYSCNGTIPFPESSDEEILVCYDCLRSGRAAITKDAELGMISWDTEALHDPTHSEVQQDQMWELLKTPTYNTWQGERWLFCCQQPMIFSGNWSRQDFAGSAAGQDPQTYFESIVEDTVPGLWEDQLHDTTGIYVFKCGTCGQKRAHWDIA